MSSDEERVGYKRPPKSGQFKPGRSGNPKGTRRRNRSIEETIDNLLFESITVVANGRPLKITKLQAMYEQLLVKAFSGNSRAGRLLLQMIRLADQANAEIRSTGWVFHERDLRF